MCSNCEPKVKLQSALNFYLSNIFVLLLLLFFFLIYLLTEKFGMLSKYTFLIVKESFLKKTKKISVFCLHSRSMKQDIYAA